MTFLNPLLLFGLFAAAIPIILHLLNLRKLKNVEFSSIKFLINLQRSQIKKIEIKKWLLLIIRTLIITFLVLAFTRPVIKNNFLSKVNSDKSAVIIFDDSQSMMRFNDSGVFFTQAKKIGINYLNSFKKNDEVLFLKLSDLVERNNFTKDFNSIKKEINNLQISFEGSTITEALKVASTLLQNRTNATKEIFVLTDNQKSNFGNYKNEELKYFSDKINIFHFGLNEKDFQNISINSVEVLSSVLKPNSIVNLNVSLSNFGEKNSTLVSIFVNDKRVAQQFVEFQSTSTKNIPISFVNTEIGNLKCRTEIENDEIESDNKFYFSINVPKNISVLLLSNKQNEDKYLIAALKTLSKSDSLQLINFKIVENLNSIKNTDIILVSSSKNLSKNQYANLLNFVNKSGIAIFLPNDFTNFDELSENIFKNFSKIKIAIENTTVKNSDFNHKIFEGMFAKNKNFETIEISKYAFFENESKIRPILNLSNGKSFLSEIDFGEGKIFFSSVGASLNWSNFPIRGIFIPLLSQMILSSNFEKSINIEIGKTTELMLNDFEIDKNLNLIDFENNKTFLKYLILSEKEFGNKIKVFLPKFNFPENYTIKSTDDEIILSCNADRKESNGSTISKNEILDELNKIGINKDFLYFIDEADKLTLKLNESRIGFEVWPILLLITAILAIIEMIISKNSKNEIE